MPYGISEAGPQWATVIESWIIDEMGVERENGVSQIFVGRESKGEITFMLAKVTDDLILQVPSKQLRNSLR